MADENKTNNYITTVQFKEQVVVQGSTTAETEEEARTKIEFAFSEMDDVEILSLEQVTEEELMAKLSVAMDESELEVAESVDPSKLN